MITKPNYLEKWAELPVKSDTSPLRVLQLNTPPLSVLGRDLDGEMMGINVLHAQIIGLLEFMGVRWGNGQIVECAQLAYTEYYYFTLAEVKQFFTRVKTGFYQSNKNMNPAVFMGFLREYGEEMMAERYDYFSKEANKPKWTPPADPISDEKFNEVMRQMLSILVVPPEPTLAETVGGVEEFEKLKQEALKKAEQLGVQYDINDSSQKAE